MSGLSSRERKLVAILILMALVAFAWLAVLAPIFSGFAARAAERDMLAARYAGSERLIASMSRLRAQAEGQKGDVTRFHDSAPDLATASDQLQERLTNQIAQDGGELKSVQDVSDQPGWVRASADGRISLPQLLALLDHLQNKPPLLVVNALSLSADRALQSGHLDLMEFHLEVSGNPTLPKPR